jgi:PAS domain S-box-containing protein
MRVSRPIALPEDVSAQAGTLEPAHSRPPRWAIWLPAGLTAGLLLATAVAFVALGDRIARQHRHLANVLEPANRKLVQFQIAFAAEAALVRSFVALPRSETLTRYKNVHQQTAAILTSLERLSPRISPEFARDMEALQGLVRHKQDAPMALLEGRLSPQSFRRRLPEQDELAGGIITAASRLDDEISFAVQRQVASLQRFERIRLFILASLVPLTLLCAILTAWFGEKARSLNQRLVRRAAEEALLRDAMTALTGTEVMPDALHRIAAIAMRVGGADGAYIERSSEGRGEVEVVAIAGDVAPPEGTRAPYIGSVTDEIVRAGQPESFGNITNHGGKIGRSIAERCEFCSGFGVPLHQNGDVHGALVLLRRDRYASASLHELIPRVWILGAFAALALRRQRLTVELQTERSRLKAVVGEMPAGVILAEAPSGRVILFNRQAVEIWRGQIRPPESIEGYGEWKCFHPGGAAYRSDEWPLARSLLAGELVQGEEAEIERADGTRSVVRFSSAPIRDARGRITSAVATVYDISEQKRREQENRFLDVVSRVLAASLDYEATLKALLQLSVPRIADFAILHLRVGPDRAIRRFESTPADTTTREVLEAIDREYSVPLSGPHPSAVAIRTGKAQLREEVTDAMLQEIAETDRHLQLFRQLGMQSAMAAPLSVRGKTLGAILLVSQDPARRYGPKDLALAEELARRAALAVDNAELFRTVSEGERRARFLAEAAQALAGSLDYEETIRRIVRLAVPFFADFAMAFITDENGSTEHVEVAHRKPESEDVLERVGAIQWTGPQNLATTVSRAMRSGKPVLVEQVTPAVVERLRLDPEIQEIFDFLAPVSWLTVPLIAGKTMLGAIVFVFAESGRRYSAEDVSLGQLLASRAALAVQNAELYSETQDALRTRDDVLAIVSHDLRNPLHTISTSAELLLEMHDDEKKQQHYLQLISRAGSSMKRLIEDLLDVARIEAGKTLTIERKAEPAHSVICEACDSYAVVAREKHVRLVCHVPRDLPEVSVDRGRIQQVLSNLISNAIKFTPEAGRVTVTAEHDRNTLRVTVKDTGPGIRAEERENIFLPFWQAMRAGRTGAGLGLTIARAIIEQHGGRIWVESEAGAGATFIFTLPVVEPAEKSRAA